VTGKYTYFLQVAITPDMREAIRVEAARGRETPSNFIRRMMTMGLAQSQGVISPLREAYEIRLNKREVRRLERLGHKLIAINTEGSSQECVVYPLRTTEMDSLY